MDDEVVPTAPRPTGPSAPAGSRRRRERRLALGGAASAIALALVGAVSCGPSRVPDGQVVKTLASPRARVVPAAADIAAEMRRTVETGGTPPVTFAPVGAPVSVGSGPGALTAIIGQRNPSADGAGQLVFFWAGSQFVGTDADAEAVKIDSVTASGDAVAVTYEGYAADDPMCCPSQPAIVVNYRWDGKRVVTTGPSWPIRRLQAVQHVT